MYQVKIVKVPEGVLRPFNVRDPAFARTYVGIISTCQYVRMKIRGAMFQDLRNAVSDLEHTKVIQRMTDSCIPIF